MNESGLWQKGRQRNKSWGVKKRKRTRQTEKRITCAASTTAALSHAGNRVGAGSVASPFTWTVLHSDSGFKGFSYSHIKTKHQKPPDWLMDTSKYSHNGEKPFKSGTKALT